MEPMQSEGLSGMSGEVTRMQRRAEDKFQDARAQIAGTVSSIARRASDAARYTHEGVQANPWTAVGIGFGAGLVLGALAIFAVSRR